ncbi:MAG TPA: glycosyl hydrolase family 28-related protein [Sedimentisphaerales bacterium]|nr:glycosyl hydrolase family 28-related protein [Sedimentisphaerales bacterium]HRS11673.1 glycosyl hydrolase family 28-related protein [Sedimentisphaerales bacterium]HRV48336.1 glycosyl hydrolase family 28-related protein [Sedimentisphaerales bacterium]
MRNRRWIERVSLTVVLVLVAAGGGCRKSGTTGESKYTGSWAQVPDILAQIGEPNIPKRDFDVTKFEAVADGTTDCRPAIMAAIAACEEAGGGRVIVPAGTYLVNGPLYLVNDMELHLAEGARLKFGSKSDDYLPLVLTRWEGTQIYNYCPFIYAYRRKNVALTGTGTLDGQAKDTWSTWAQKQDKGIETVRRWNQEGTPVVDRFLGDGYFLRPSMVGFLGCTNVLVDGVTIVDSPFWCLHPIYSKNVTIHNVRIDSHNPDNDGIVLDSCEYVHVHGVTVAGRGACVAVRSGAGREGREMNWASRNIYVHDCTFDAETAVSIAGEICGGVYNVFAEDCRAGQGLQPAVTIADVQTREGEIAHVRYRNAFGLDVRDPNAANQPPDVYAGPDVQLGEQGGTVTLSGSVVDDGKPLGKLTYAWSVIQGQADAVKLATPAALKTQATFSRPGVYVLQLEAGDGEAAGRHFSVVKVGEQPDDMISITRPVFPAGESVAGGKDSV